MPNNAIQVLTSLEYLGPYYHSEKQADGSFSKPVISWYYGLVLQVGLGEVDGASQDVQVTPGMAEFFKPWDWNSPVAGNWWPQIQLWKYKVGDITTLAKSANDPVPVDISTYDCPDVRTQLESDCDTAIKNQHLSWKDPGTNGSSTIASKLLGYPWPAQLAQVARLPYPIPHILRLSYLLKVKDSDFATPDSAYAYLATVTFVSNASGAKKTYTPQTSKAALIAISNGQSRITIPYDDPNVFLATQPLTNFVQAATVVGANVLTPEITDWQAHLVAGCADLFDLPARLVGLVRTDCADVCTAIQQSVASNFNSYVTAFLTAQRNILSYGALRGPSGSSLLSRLCKQWVNQDAQGDSAFAKTFEKAVEAQLKADQINPDQSVVQDAWLLLLKFNPSLTTSALIGPPPDVNLPYDPNTVYKTGQTVLYHGQLYRARKDAKLAAPSVAPSDWTQVSVTYSVDPSHLSQQLIAVEHLQQQFMQNDTLIAMLLSLWDNIPAIDASKYRSFRNSAANALTKLNVRGLLLEGNLQDSWPAIVGDPSRDKMRANIPAELHRRIAAMATPVAASLADAAQKWASRDQTINALVPRELATASANPQASPPQQTRTSEGLSVLLGSLDAAAAPAKDAVDDLRQINGLCVLMREQTENIWRCLNVGNPTREVGDSFKSAVTALANPAVVPMPQHTQDGLRRATLTYNNQPLMSESSAHGFSNGIVPSQPAIRPRLVRFRHPSAGQQLESSGLSQWKIPGLAFNRMYDILIGRISNAGALPAAFADPVLGPAVLSFGSINLANLAPSISNIPYRRTVPVSGLRFGPTGRDLNKISLPPIPLDVLPRARDNSARADQPAPLIMLASYGMSGSTDTFALKILKPTTDLLTWDRWMAALDANSPGTDSDIRKLRAQVWQRFNWLARQESSKSTVSLDDPALRHLTVTIDGVPGLSGADAMNTKSWTAPFTKPDPGHFGNVVLPPADPLQLVIRVSETVPPKIFDTDTWTLTVKPGTLATITLQPSMDADDQKRFASCIDPSNLAKYTLVLETASKDFPDSDTIRKGLTIAAPDGISTTTVDFVLQSNSLTNIGSAEIHTQVWRWDGRPSMQYPFSEKTMPPSKKVLEWELEAFSSRIASDATTRPMTRSNSAHLPSGVAFEAHDDRANDPCATFYRAAVIGYNRYGSLVPASSQSVSSITEFASVPGADGGWVRSFIPCTLPSTYVPPKPAIKFIVPLTGTVDQSQPQPRAASVLVIIQGPWYALGGLAEEMRVNIAHASESLDFNPSFQEAGPDPTLFAGLRGNLPKQYQDYGATPSRFYGPVGHTFDSSDANPLWIYSSFVLDPPLAKLGTGTSPVQEGTFAAVQFKRVIRREGLVSPPPQGDLNSAVTEPVWVQFLPTRFSPLTTSVDGLQLKVAAGGSATIMQGNNVVTLSHALNNDNKTEHLLFALLITEEVPDLLGRKGQERFVDVLLKPARPDDGSTAAPGSTTACWSGSAGLRQGPSYVGRVLVVQRQVNTSAHASITNIPLSSAQGLWAEMFPGDDTTDVSSRIVAVSPPIFTDVQISCMVDTGGQK
jgi:hypothetical protein